MQLTDFQIFRNQCLINGEWVGTSDYPIKNPATHETICKVPDFGNQETNLAIQHADTAFATWSETSAKDRSIILRKWFNLITQNAEELAKILTTEQGKPLTEARAEITYAASFVEFFAEEAKRVYGETIPCPLKDSRILVLKQPIGVVACITPWNFPAAMITRKVSPALAVGCTAIVKPAPETPLTALALGELALQAGLPKGVLQIITGNAQEIGKAIMDSSIVKAVSFTGSTAVGKLLMSQAAATVKRVSLELGGNAPFIVFDDADLEAAVEGAIVSKFRNMGQTCICANRIFVQEGIYDAFIDRLNEKVSQFQVGNGMDLGTTQGPLINQAAIEKSINHVQDAVDKGAEIITGGTPHELGGNFFEPTILKNATTQMRLAQEETFGPVAAIFKFKTDQEVIHMANDTNSGLAAYFYSKDLSRIWKVSEKLQYGMVAINSGMLSTELAPFGGVKESGLGREGSHHGIDEYIEMKYLMMSGI